MENNPKLSDIFPSPAEVKKLQFFLGDWTVEGTLSFEGKPFNVTGLWRFSSVSAGWGVLNVGKMQIAGLGAYEEVDLLGFDPGEKMFHLFSVTNTAAAHDHKGKWLDDKRISFLYEGLQEGKPYKEEIELKILSSTEFTIHEKDTLGNQVISTMDATMRKQI
jgi:hypothetical protein